MLAVMIARTVNIDTVTINSTRASQYPGTRGSLVKFSLYVCSAEYTL